jgi:ABC-type sugar transport system ATPase subunit
MEDGRIVQCNEPRTLYNEPEEVFGGWFLGNPGMNFVAARCAQTAENDSLISSFLKSPLGISTNGLDREATIGIRPEHIKVSENIFSNAVNANVKRKSITVGGQFLFVLEVDKVEVKAKVGHPTNELMNAQSVWVEFPVEHIVLFNQNQKRVHADLAY